MICKAINPAPPEGLGLDEDATNALCRAIVRAEPRGRQTSREVTGRRRGRALVVGLCGAVVVSAAGAATVVWSPEDVPKGGTGAEAFVLADTVPLPGGRTQTRPANYDRLPTRPSLAFAPGVTYAQALREFYLARQAGLRIPSGVELAEPLPAGKVALIDGDTVRLDPAAPVGYTLGAVRMVRSLVSAPSVAYAPPLPRCQVLIGAADPNSPDCRSVPAVGVPQLQEQAAGSWTPVADEPSLDVEVRSGTDLAILTRPTGPDDQAPARAGQPAQATPQVADTASRLMGEFKGVRFFIATTQEQNQICFVAATPTETGSSCKSHFGHRHRRRDPSANPEPGRRRPGGRHRLGRLHGRGTQQRGPHHRANNLFVFATNDRSFAPEDLTLTGPRGAVRIRA